jgi:hypothetical protein
LSWEKEKIEESTVKRSILTTFVATKAQKRLKLTLTISFDIFKRLYAMFLRFGAHFGQFRLILGHFLPDKASRKVRFG